MKHASHSIMQGVAAGASRPAELVCSIWIPALLADALHEARRRVAAFR